MMNTLNETQSITQTIATLKQQLTELRTEHGFWEGELSTSALSTATAVCALAMVLRYDENNTISHNNKTKYQHMIANGIQWLVDYQNPDGGWGDTTISHSNISTTILCWAVLDHHDLSSNSQHQAIQKAEQWITQEAGGITPDHISKRILKKYGKDKTFSVPILTHCALAGKLGEFPHAWSYVLQLPFELAAFPHSWFAALRLPVVSYALPALIAIGLVRHHHRPTKNPFNRILRNRLINKTLKKLTTIQPQSGGFLEAIPLTSFVTMSLAASVGTNHPVLQKGLQFINDSVRPDGSWPIDTNLATWVTTLSINALGADPNFTQEWSLSDRQTLLNHLLNHQYRERHPYTHAPAGGWAWTHLPGGVPDGDDTSGALLALHHLQCDDPQLISSIELGLQWLINLQNSDGGIPTFCRGWTNLPFDRSCPDITAHALKAASVWKHHVSQKIQTKILHFERKAIHYLINTQQSDGSWIPLWFGHQDEENLYNKTYGTAQVITALASIQQQPDTLHQIITRGVEWIISAQQNNGGWGGGNQSAPSIEETALAVTALTTFLKHQENGLDHNIITKVKLGIQWLEKHYNPQSAQLASPIGFYFAELWYYEKMYPIIYMLQALLMYQNIIKSDN